MTWQPDTKWSEWHQLMSLWSLHVRLLSPGTTMFLLVEGAICHTMVGWSMRNNWRKIDVAWNEIDFGKQSGYIDINIGSKWSKHDRIASSPTKWLYLQGVRWAYPLWHKWKAKTKVRPTQWLEMSTTPFTPNTMVYHLELRVTIIFYKNK